MKKLIMAVTLFLMLGCSKAEQLSYEKNQASRDFGLTRKVTLYSSYTGQVIFERTFKNSYFESGTTSDIDILDLKTKTKTSIKGQNFIIVIDELEETPKQ